MYRGDMRFLLELSLRPPAVAHGQEGIRIKDLCSVRVSLSSGKVRR